jgi:drug/metabolite transporter (DMT)-like permease
MTRAALRAVSPVRGAIEPLRGAGRWDRHGTRVVLALVAVYVIWGSTFLAIKVAVTTMPPFTMMAVRFLVAGGLLYLWASRRGDRRGDRPSLAQWRHAVLTGGMLLVGGTGLVSLAQTRIDSGTAALLTSTVPLWLALFGRTFLGERLSSRVWLGLLIGLVGVGLLVDPTGGGELGPLVLVVLGAIGWAAGSLRSRVAPSPVRPLVAASMEMLGAALVFAVVGVASGEVARLDVAAIDGPSVLAFAYLTTAGSIVAFTAYSWLLRNATTSLVGTHAYVNPVVAVGLGWALAGEVVTGRTLVAGAVILGSVVLLITGRPGVPVPAQATSGGDVFAGRSRWRRIRPRVPALAPRVVPAVERVSASAVRSAREEFDRNS